jgi:hypothetical protein
MSHEIYIPIYSNGGTSSQTTNSKLSENLGLFIDSTINVVKPVGDYEASSGETVKATVSGTSSTISLPAFVTDVSKRVKVIKIDSPVKDIIVDCIDGKQIEGLSQFVLAVQWDKATFEQDPDTGNWEIW